jgi:molybdopterin-guanine dinucleotide biosynthesis protein B
LPEVEPYPGVPVLQQYFIAPDLADATVEAKGNHLNRQILPTVDIRGFKTSPEVFNPVGLSEEMTVAGLKAIAVVGFKDAGKTRVVEALVSELTRRGKSVATLKHTAEFVSHDTPGKDTWRHMEAGAEASAIISDSSAAFFVKKGVTPQEAAALLGSYDYLVMEGFKSEGYIPRIIVPRELSDIAELANGLEVAVVDVEEALTGYADTRVYTLDEVGDLADVVEEKAFPLLAGLNCRGCGYEDCASLAKAIMAGEARAKSCVMYASAGVRMVVNGKVVPLNAFAQLVTKNVVLGLVDSLKGIEGPRRVEVALDVEREG